MIPDVNLVKIIDRAQNEASEDLKSLMLDWVNHIHEGKGTRARAAKLEELLQQEKNEHTPFLNELYSHRDLFVKPSQWICRWRWLGLRYWLWGARSYYREWSRC